MELEVLALEFSVCKVADAAQLAPRGEFCFTARTDAEDSLVCPTACVPEGTLERVDGWRAFRVRGVLDFSLIGVLAKLAGVLAERGIAIFAVSTYDTDYILTKREDFERALCALAENGFSVVR